MNLPTVLQREVLEFSYLISYEKVSVCWVGYFTKKIRPCIRFSWVSLYLHGLFKKSTCWLITILLFFKTQFSLIQASSPYILIITWQWWVLILDNYEYYNLTNMSNTCNLFSYYPLLITVENLYMKNILFSTRHCVH